MQRHLLVCHLQQTVTIIFGNQYMYQRTVTTIKDHCVDCFKAYLMNNIQMYWPSMMGKFWEFLQSMLPKDMFQRMFMLNDTTELRTVYEPPNEGWIIHRFDRHPGELVIPYPHPHKPIYNSPTIPITPSMLRAWEPLVDYCSVDDGNHNVFRFKLVTYNVLAQILLESRYNYYNHNGVHDLSWETRSEKIFNEIQNLDPDVICFQEVQETHMSFYDRFTCLGYYSVFKKKTSDKDDGCAILYKNTKFHWGEGVLVEFHVPQCKQLLWNNVGIIAKFRPLCSPNTPFVVANTHLLYKKEENSARLAQMRLFLERVSEVTYQGPGKGNLPLILTGDFNCPPNSEVIKLLEEGSILLPMEESLGNIGLPETIEYSIAEDYNGSPEDVSGQERSREKAIRVMNPFKLSSVYTLDRQQSPGYGKWVTVDYIFFSHESLTAVERLSIPPFWRKIPDDTFASDHLAIAGVFEMKIGDSNGEQHPNE